MTQNGLSLHKSAATRGASRTPQARSRPRRQAQPVTVTRPTPAVWRAALALADGDPTRLRVIDERTVLVANHANGQRGR